LLAEHGFEIVELPVTRDGVVKLEDAKKTITERTLLVSVQAANNELGTLQPIAEVADIAHGNGAYFHTDAAQILGKLPFDVQSVNCDFASFSAHKMYGPKGVGALFVRGGARRWPWERPFRGGGQEMGLRPGTSNVPAIVGFGEACSISQNYIQANYQTAIYRLEENLLACLKCTFPESVVYSLDVPRLPGVFSIALPNIPADLLIGNLQVLAVGKGAACSNRSISISHVLAQIGCDSELAKSTIRISLGRNASQEDINEAVEMLRCSFCEVNKALR